MSCDAHTQGAMITFDYKGGSYTFSYKQAECSATSNLNTLCYGISRLIDLDIRGILPFQKTGREYLALTGGTETTQNGVDDYKTLETTPSINNVELKERYLILLKTNHPDKAVSEDQKNYMTEKTAAINTAYKRICQRRGL